MKILPNGLAVIEGDTHISQWVVDSHKLDHDEYTLGIVLPFIEEGHWVVDAGAFIGDHTTAYLKRVGTDGKVFAFEPNPVAYNCLCHNCPEAVTFNCGLSDKETVASYRPNQNAGAGHIEHSEGDIKLLTLDSLNLRHCHFLKVDVEGWEFEALMGAERTILANKPTMWVEVNQGSLERNQRTPDELLDLITNHFGYNVQAYPPERGPQYDILCIP